MQTPRAKTVCSCWSVSESEICNFIATGPTSVDTLAALQGALKCGTQCGSCVPELKRLIASGKAAA
jgi:assimilatory nitrate reductase catalytic subunit